MNRSCFLFPFVGVMLLVFAFSSCTTVSWLAIERLTPAEQSLPDEVRRIGVVNNQPSIPSSQVSPFCAPMTLIDSRKIADSLAVFLAGTDYFDEVVICDSALLSPTATLHEAHSLSPEDVSQLCSLLNVDMLASIELAIFERDLSSEYPVGEVYTLTVFYRPGEHPDSVVRHSTIVWEDYSCDEQAETDLVALAVSLPAAVIVPHWKAVDLPYYSNASSEFREAAFSIREGDADRARLIWEDVLASRMRKKRILANFNLAVWHDVYGNDLGKTREYLHKARQLAVEKKKKNAQGEPLNPTEHYKLIRSYERQIEARERDLLRLNSQLQRFSEAF